MIFLCILVHDRLAHGKKRPSHPERFGAYEKEGESTACLLCCVVLCCVVLCCLIISHWGCFSKYNGISRHILTCYLIFMKRYHNVLLHCSWRDDHKKN